MPLSQLADEIIRLGDRNSSTPVLVVPSYLALRPKFFVALIDSLSQKSNRPVRIDWYRSGDAHAASLIGNWWAARTSAAINRRLRRGSVQITAAIARPDRNGSESGGPDELIVGLCDERHELSSWTTPIRLAG